MGKENVTRMGRRMARSGASRKCYFGELVGLFLGGGSGGVTGPYGMIVLILSTSDWRSSSRAKKGAFPFKYANVILFSQ